MPLITVSGHCKDPSGANIAGHVVFTLCNFGANVPRVIGTNAMVPVSVTVDAAANGSWSTNIQGNDSIDPGAGNTPPTTFYNVSFLDASKNTIQILPFSFTGAGPNNLDSQAPLNVVPSPTTPPNNAALLAANQTFTGNNTFNGTTTLGTVAGNVAFTGSPTVAGTLNVTGLLEAQAGISVDGTHIEAIPANASTLVDLSASQTLTSKTLTSPVINGTPTGTGIPTITLKKGSGSGDYTASGTSYADVDAANLGYTVTIPTGWKLSVQVSGAFAQSTAVNGMGLAIFDTQPTAVLVESVVAPALVGNALPFSLSWAITGDGNAHTVKLQAKTLNASDAWVIRNASATALPTMVFILSPSN